MKETIIEIKKSIKTTKYSERNIVTIDNLIEALQKASQKYGGDKEVQVAGCYGSMGSIEEIHEYVEEHYFDGVLLVSDICSG